MLPKDSVYQYVDLSNDSITKFPDLSDYTIRSLNISHNLLDTLIISYLPKEIGKLDLSWNCFEKTFLYRDNGIKLKELNLSNNFLERVDIGETINRIIISYNNITYINLYHKDIHYFDISYNPNLSNVVNFTPSLIDTVIRVGIANDLPIYDLMDYMRINPVP
ncbi:MAG: hypothetical protein Q4G18_08620 [Myroides sp.]|nr:hypothetical protein [Myroides sp.]